MLLQAGLKAKIERIEVVNDNCAEITVFHLYISDDMVQRELRKRDLDLIVPVIIYGLQQVFISAIYFF